MYPLLTAIVIGVGITIFVMLVAYLWGYYHD